VEDDRARFERLYADHAPEIAMYALRRADRETAQDVVSETFTIVWRRLDDVPAEPLAWLYGVARRVLSNQRRSASRLAALRRKLDRPHQPPEIEDGLVAAALAGLSESDRELLLLVGWEGLTPAEAATVLDVSPETCRVRLHRARARFASALEPSSNGSMPTTTPEEIPWTTR
jgi:RNA polymerase sigma-70 factor (ECF subfamily)